MTKFDLTLSLIDKEHGIGGHIEYSTDLFNRDTIERMAQHFQALLEGIAAEPDQSIPTLPIMTEPERNQILFRWNDTTVDYSKDKCIHELFEAQVERTPDAIAVKYEGQHLTYLDLNRCSNQLAHYLIGLGVGPEGLVGICVERSIIMVVGLLAILKAGAAYVPLEPSYPKERVMFMIKEAQPALVLTEERIKFDLEEYDCEIVCVDSDWNEIAKQSVINPTPVTKPHDLAYVMFTSGSTGHPKGVMITHHGISNRLLWMQDAYQLAQSDRVLHKTPISFDVSVWEMFWPLLNGASVVVARPGGHQDSAYLAELIAQQTITVLHFVPSMLQVFLEQPTLDGCSDLRLVICSGEALSVALQERFFARFDAELHNLYGPTEASIDVTCWACARGSDLRTIPIGRPIANTQIYILDSHMQPEPIGVPGMLYIGGDGLARGYLNRPELTAENFIGNPFSSVPGERLYRTGDRARYLPDGNIEFLGRADNQVKIRGYRIELGEIEAALDQHPGVKESVLVARDRDSLTEENLIGYVVPKDQPAPSVTELRDYLKGKLPEYMLPSAFIFLDAFPLNPNGKMDRHALPTPDGSRPQLIQRFVDPRTEIEELTAQVWKEMLKLEKIGVFDNFFELGGHSLLATRIIARLRNNFSIDIPLRKLFELPTIAALAEHIEALRREENGFAVRPIMPVSRDRDLPLSFSQHRLWFLHELDSNLAAYNMPSIFHIKGPLDASVLETALNSLIARHEVLRTRFAVVGGAPVQEIVSSMHLQLPVFDLGELPEPELEQRARELALEEARRPFDLPNGPLVRAMVVNGGDRSRYFILNLHHGIMDGWSLGILFRELGALYEGLSGDTPCSLPSLPVQYADYAVWQREFMQGEVLDAQLSYWRHQLKDAAAPYMLATDYPRPASQTFHGARHAFALSREFTQSLKLLSRRAGVTPFMTILAAIKILLSRYSGQDDVVVGSTIAGRGRPEIEGLIGFFINALPLRTDLSGNPNFLELLQRVREVCLGAYSHQEVPFDKIVEAINPKRDFSRNPLFQVMFNMVDVSERVLQLSGCEVRKKSFFDPEAKFDVTVYAPEKDGAIELAVVYNVDLFSQPRIAAMLEQLSYLLAQIVDGPQGSIGDYSLVSPVTRRFLPDPSEPLDDTWDGPIHDYVTEWAKRAPNRPALTDPTETWSYGELETHSNQIAHYLIAQGIQPKDVVAIYAHRSSTLVLALQGVLKAGAVFAILDPAYPPARLIDYLRIAQPRVWIQMDAAAELPKELVTCLETLNISCRLNLPRAKQAVADVLREQPESQPFVVVVANDPAYIAFTSGSTGEPKGVLSRHGPITHFLPWQKEAFDLHETDRFCLLSGLAYNHLHRDVFTPLALGATLYVPPVEIAREPEPLTDWLRANAISVLHLTPALGQLLLTGEFRPLPAVRRVFFGGDVLTRGEIAQIRPRVPNARISGFYGATETQRAVGYFEIPDDFSMNDGDTNRPIPLGRGVKDVQLLLLNKAGQLAGVGELGELYVRSPHLAESYIGDEKLTNETFVTNPFTNDPRDRLYRTGEMGRYLPDGNVEWAGRNDRRVNIRGFRVDLEEVESVLKQHPMVQNAAVVLQEFELPESDTSAFEDSDNPKSKTRTEPSRSIQNPKSDGRLVAYVATDEAGESMGDLLRSFVSTRLPEYMVPAHFVILEQLPLSPNGKVDYRALPPVQQFLLAESSLIQAPRNEVEVKLCAIFSQVLGREQVGIEENFFRLGGHSLLAAQAAARVRATFSVGLELRTFLESPTVAALANEIEIRLKPADTIPVTEDPDREEIEL
jgi:amino acid adenylation domain-containing protein